MEEIFRINTIQSFLKHFSSHNWKKIAILMIEYGVMVFEHNFNMKQMSFNDVVKVIEDLKYENYNYTKNQEKNLLSSTSQYLSNSINNLNLSNNINNSNNNLINNQQDTFSNINNNNLNSSGVFFSSNNFNNQNNNHNSNFQHIVSSNNNTSHAFFSPNRSMHSKQNSVNSITLNRTLRSQKIEEALEKSPQVKPGKFVFVEEDPDRNEVIIKVNKETYENQLRSKNNYLTFVRGKPSSKSINNAVNGSKVTKHNSKNHLKPMKEQNEEKENNNDRHSNNENKKKIINKVVSVNEILNKLNVSPKKVSKKDNKYKELRDNRDKRDHRDNRDNENNNSNSSRKYYDKREKEKERIRKYEDTDMYYNNTTDNLSETRDFNYEKNERNYNREKYRIDLGRNLDKNIDKYYHNISKRNYYKNRSVSNTYNDSAYDNSSYITDKNKNKTVYIIKKPKGNKSKRVVVRTYGSESSDLSAYDDYNQTTEEIVFKGKKSNRYDSNQKHKQQPYSKHRVFSNSHKHKKG